MGDLPWEKQARDLCEVRSSLLSVKWTGQPYPEFAVKAIEIAIDALQAPESENVNHYGNERMAELNKLAEDISAAIDKAVPRVEQSPAFDRLRALEAKERDGDHG